MSKSEGFATPCARTASTPGEPEVKVIQVWSFATQNLFGLFSRLKNAVML
jgi:hypothetical protein